MQKAKELQDAIRAKRAAEEKRLAEEQEPKLAFDAGLGQAAAERNLLANVLLCEVTNLSRTKPETTLD